MAFTVDPTAIIVGAGNVYHRALSVLTPWTSIGATMDDTAVRITQAWFRPDLNHVLGDVQGLDYKVSETAEMEFTVMEVSPTNAPLVIPGATSTVGTGADASGSPFSSTTSAATVVGATTVPMTAVTNLSVGDAIQIDVDGSLAEYRVITAIDTLDVSFRDPLQQAHASGVVAVETDDDYKTDITGSSVRRQPDSAYKQWALVAEAPDGYYELVFDSGISSTEQAELTFGDETAAGFRTTIQSRFAGATPTTAPWNLRVPN